MMSADLLTEDMLSDTEVPLAFSHWMPIPPLPEVCDE